MENQPSPYQALLPPIIIGFLSIVGIGLILLIVYLNTPTADTPPEPTSTQFKFLLLATETDIATSEEKKLPADSLRTPTDTETGIDTNTQRAGATSPTPASGNPTGTQTTPQATRTTSITFNNASTFLAGKYDDFDERLIYDGDWSGEFQISGAYEETISYSTTVGSAISFNFAGRQLQIGYLGETDLGLLLISISGDEYLLDQSTESEWLSPQFPYGTYTVLLTHLSGDQVFLDYISVIGSP